MGTDDDYRQATPEDLAQERKRVDDALMNLTLTRPHWLYASGTPERLEVLRSPLMRDGDNPYPEVDRFIREHGLVLGMRETFQHPHFMFASADASVYVSPAARNAGGELIPTIDGFAGTTAELLARTTREHVNDNWPFPPEAAKYVDPDPELN